MAATNSNTENGLVGTATRTDFVATFLPEKAQVALLRRRVAGDDGDDEGVGPVTIQTIIIGVNPEGNEQNGEWSDNYVYPHETHAGNFCHIKPVLSPDNKYCLFDLRDETHPFAQNTQLIFWNIATNSHTSVAEGRISSCCFFPSNDESTMEFFYAKRTAYDGPVEIFKRKVGTDGGNIGPEETPTQGQWGPYLCGVCYKDDDGLRCKKAVLSYNREWDFYMYIWRCSSEGLEKIDSEEVKATFREAMCEENGEPVTEAMCEGNREPVLILSPDNTFAAVLKLENQGTTGRVVLLELKLSNEQGSSPRIQFVGTVPKTIKETDDYPLNFVLCFSPDNKYLATSGSSDGFLDIWLREELNSSGSQNQDIRPVASLSQNSNRQFKSGKWLTNYKLAVVYTEKCEEEKFSLWLGTFDLKCSDNETDLVECRRDQICDDASGEDADGPKYFDIAFRSQWMAVTGTDVGAFVVEDSKDLSKLPRRIDTL